MHMRRALLALTCCGLLLDAAKPAQPKIPPKPKVSALAQRWLKSLSLHDEIAQLIVVSCYGEAVNVRSRQYRQYAKLIRDEHVGGVIVVGHVQYGSVRNADPYAMAALLNRFQHLAKIPLLVAADFERGASMRVNATTAWPYNMAFAAAHDVNGSRNEGAATAREARTLGVNWLFAPVADVNNNPDNPIINIRSYGENPQDVAAHVEAYIEGAHSDSKNPVLVTVKHFPGHGDTATDSHLGLARLDAAAERVNSVELIPFRAAVDKGVDAVMTAHIAVPSLDATGVPATVSQPILTGILREQLKFTGIIVTDAMEMQGLLEMFNTREAAVRALEAGADVLLMPAKVEDAIAGVTAAINSGRLTRKRLDESALRVLSAKVRLGLNRQKPATQDAIAELIGAPEEEEMAQQIADRAVTLVKDSSDMLPVRNSDTASLLVLAESRSGQQGRHLMEEIKKRAPKMKITLLDASMSKEDMDRVVQSTAGSSSVIVAAYATVNAGRGDVALGGEYPALMSALLKGSAPVTLAALGNPYLLRNFPDVKAYLTTYSTTSTSETALAKALFGEIAIGGRLPVSIPGLAKYGDGIQLPATNSNPKGL
jgi:beta-N-acetylhexosaminidase